MFYRVIISHNQTKCLYKFPRVSSTVVVFDSPTDADLDACKSLGYRAVVVAQSGNRGVNRNAGLNEIMNAFNPNDDGIIEFLDGDRYPSSQDSANVSCSLIEENHLDCLLYTCGGSDTRLQKLFVPLSGVSIIDTGTLCNPFYSCGFAMRVSAIRRVMKENMGAFFEPRFTRWGCEDQFMGLVCDNLGFRTGITCEITINGNVGGDSNSHSDYRESLQTYVDLIRERNYPIRNAPRE